jgi:hypothetical protein
MSNNDCMASYNQHGGRATGPASVSKAFLLGACKWFDEQDAVLPWLGRKDGDRKRLAAIGLALDNFLSPHVTESTAGTPKKFSVAKIQRSKPKPVAVKQVAGQRAVDESSDALSDDDYRDLQDDEASAPEYEEPPERTWDHQKYRKIPNSIVLCDKEKCEGPDIHVLMKTAMNAFDIEEESTQALIVDGERYMVKKNLFFNTVAL